MIEFVEGKNGVIKVVDKDTREELLEEFEHVELEPTFGAYFIGHTCGQEDVIVFSKTGERLYTFEGNLADNFTIEHVLDEVVKSEAIVNSMKKMKKVVFWGNPTVQSYVLKKHEEINQQRKEREIVEGRPQKAGYIAVMEELERNDIETFFEKQSRLRKHILRMQEIQEKRPAIVDPAAKMTK